MPNQSKRDQLTRERLAEETLNAPAALGTRLMWFSAITNFGACTYMLSQVETGSSSFLINMSGMVLAFAPVLFRTAWQSVAEDQDSYKKRIYGPVAFNSMSPAVLNPINGKIDPGVQLAFTF